MVQTVQGFISETLSFSDQKNEHLSKYDLELMACDLLKINRTKLFSSSIHLDSNQIDRLSSMVNRRNNGEPLAYILGTKEFWNLNLEVNNSVLVPRPETEVIVEDILSNFHSKGLSVLDLGTGSGAIGLSLKQERKDWHVYCSDLSKNALNVAKQNSIKHNLEIYLVCSNWLNSFKHNCFDLIISNPPYIEEGNPNLISDGLKFEPKEALVSGLSGKEHLYGIVSSAGQYLRKGGYLYLEHAPKQAKELMVLMKNSKFTNSSAIYDLNGDKRAIKAQSA